MASAKTEGTCRACGTPILIGDDLCGRNRHANCVAARQRHASPVAAPVSRPAYPTTVAQSAPVVRTCRRCGGPVSAGGWYCGECED